MTYIRFETLHVQIVGDMHRHDMPANCDDPFTAGAQTPPIVTANLWPRKCRDSGMLEVI